MSGVTRPAAYFSLSLPVVFWLLASSLAQRPTEACLPFRARLGKNVEEISAAPEHLFPGAGPDAGGARRGGAVAHNPEDSNQKTRKRFSKSRGGHGGACGAGTTPNSRTRSGRPLVGCELASTKPPGTSTPRRIFTLHLGIKKEPANGRLFQFSLRTGNLWGTVRCGLSTRMNYRRGCWH